MARYSQGRSFSPRRRSPTPPRGRKRYEDDHYHDSRSIRDRRSPAPSGLLIRNLPLDARPEDLRIPFERYGPVKDIYLPKDYYTGEPRGFGFVKYRHAEDAAEAKQRMNYKVIGGREMRIVFAEENRKTPKEMRTTGPISGQSGRSQRRTPPRSPRRRYNSYSRSPSQARGDPRFEINPNLKSFRRREARDDYYSPREQRSISRSVSPRDERDYRSNQKSPNPRENGDSLHNERDHLPIRLRSPRGNIGGPSRSRSRSMSPR